MPSVAWSGQTFALIDPRPGKSCAYDPALNRWRLECRAGDRRPEDKATVERIGLDGWAQPMPLDKLHVTAFSYKPISGCSAAKAGDWQVIYETHVKSLPGEYEGVGPLKIVSEWSEGSQASVLRVYRHAPKLDALGRMTGVTPHVLASLMDITPGSLVSFLINERFGADGLLKVWIGGKLVVDYAGAYGYGPRAPYRCLRIYRNARAETAKAEFRGLSVG